MITVVSGLPRSGTSLVMQMLAAGGIPVLGDDLRRADEDNPRGYLEYEKVKSLERDSTWLPEAEGKAIKIISFLLPKLPSSFEYRVIFVRRNLTEVLRSQEKMLEVYNNSLVTLGFGYIGKTNLVGLKGRDFEVPLTGTAYLAKLTSS